MSIVYLCRYCNYVIGELDQHVVQVSALGLDTLSEKEKREIVHYQANGDVYLKITCENCQESLEQHPDYHGLDFLIQ